MSDYRDDRYPGRDLNGYGGYPSGDPRAYGSRPGGDPGAYRGNPGTDPRAFGSYPGGSSGGCRSYPDYNSPYSPPPKKKSKKLPFILGLIGALLLLAIILGAVFALTRPRVSSSYKATWDMKDLVNAQFGGLAVFDSLNVDYYMDLNKDKTYRLYLDEDQLKEAYSEGLSGNDLINGLVGEDAIREYVDESVDATGSNTEGTYKVNGRKIIFDPGSDEESEATIGKDGSFTMSIDDDSIGHVDLVFEKQ